MIIERTARFLGILFLMDVGASMMFPLTYRGLAQRALQRLEALDARAAARLGDEGPIDLWPAFEGTIGKGEN